jgi:hypothetical protein
MLGFGTRGRRQLDRLKPSDRRASPRGRVLLSGKIVYGSGFTADCAIRDLSRSGACVILPQHQASPPDFYLIVVRDGIVHRSRTLWTRHPLAGLAFESSHDFSKDTPVHLQTIRALWGALAPRA